MWDTLSMLFILNVEIIEYWKMICDLGLKKENIVKYLTS